MEHTLSINPTLKVTGVTKVEGYSKTKIILKLDNKNLTIEGENLDLFKIDIAGGNIEASGEIHSLRYQTGGLNGKFVSKLLKWQMILAQK